MSPAASAEVDLDGAEAFRAFAPAADALRRWLLDGGLPAASPDPRYRAVPAYDDAATTITLDAADLACLDVLTGSTAALTLPPESGLPRRRSETARDLLARGILVSGEGGPAIAPAWFSTVGLAFLGPRATRVAWPDEPVWADLSAVRAPGRAVVVESVGGGQYRVSAALPGEARDRLEAAVALDGYDGADLPETARFAMTEAKLLEASRWVDDRQLPEPSPDLQGYVRIVDGPGQWRRDVRDVWSVPGSTSASAWGYFTGGPSGLWLESRESPAADPVVVQRVTVPGARAAVRDAVAEPGRAHALWQAALPAGPQFVGTGEAPRDAFFGALRRWWWLILGSLVVVGGGLVLATQRTGNPVFAGIALVLFAPPVVGLYIVVRWNDYLLPRSRPRTFTPRSPDHARSHESQDGPR